MLLRTALIRLGFTLLAATCCTPFAWAQQGKLDELEQTLKKRTEAERAAAKAGWEKLGAAFLADGDDAVAAELRAFGPAIQIPLIQELDRQLSADPISDVAVERLLSVLREVTNKNGADRIAARLGKLPETARISALRTIAERGSRRSHIALETRLSSENKLERNAAQLALLEFGDTKRCIEWLSAVPLEQMTTQQRVRALEVLGRRELPAESSLPVAWHSMDQGKEAEALFAYWIAHPDPQIEEAVLETVLNPNRLLGLREAGLQILEHGVNELKWRDSKRKLGAILRNKDGDALAAKTAWALHRMGEKSGARYLLDGPEEAVKRDKNSWRAHLALGELEVRLGDFRSAYKSYSNSLRLAEISRSTWNSRDYLYAARAAAGAKKEREAGEWLARSRMSPRELAPYRDLPEFEPYRDKQPFARLFGNP